MVTIRLQRMGAKKRPFYRLVAVHSHRKRNGKPLAKLGFYNPIGEKKELRIYKEPTLRWYFQGARASDTAYALLKRAGLVETIRLIKTKKLSLEDALKKAHEEDATLLATLRPKITTVTKSILEPRPVPVAPRVEVDDEDEGEPTSA